MNTAFNTVGLLCVAVVAAPSWAAEATGPVQGSQPKESHADVDPIAVGDMVVVVTKDTSILMRGDEKITTLKKGQRLRALRFKGEWIGATVSVGDKRHEGWVNISDVMIETDSRSRFHDPHGIDRTPSPPDEENPKWRQHLGEYVKTSKGVVVISSLGDALRLARIHSPEYCRKLEATYLAALEVQTAENQDQTARARKLLRTRLRDLHRFRQDLCLRLAVGEAGLAGYGGQRSRSAGEESAQSAGHSGRRCGEVAGYLGLVRDAIAIRNQERSVAALRESLRQLGQIFDMDPSGGTQADSVELARQVFYGAQNRLVSAKASYETALDDYKTTLGLPPDLPVHIEDPTLNRFNLIDPTMTALQDSVEEIRDRLSDPREPLPADHQARVADIRRRCEHQIKAVQEDLRVLVDSLPKRGKALLNLSFCEEFQRGELDPTMVDVDAFHERVVVCRVDYYGPGNPDIARAPPWLEDTHVAKAAADLLSTLRQRGRFLQLERDRRRAGIEGVSVMLKQTLDMLKAFEKDPKAATKEARADLAQGTARLEPKDVLANLFTRLWRQLTELSLIQARARLEAVTLTPAELTLDDAVVVARANRVDWRTWRETASEQWRRIDTLATSKSPVEGDSLQRERVLYQQARRELIQFEDGIKQDLREILRKLRNLRIKLEICRVTVFSAILQVEFGRRALDAPRGAPMRRG
ncbi:MAG: hypothetical protein ACYTG0_32920, partial [Planctomycetota bacterium]